MPTPRLLLLLATTVAVTVLASGCAVSGEGEAEAPTRHRDLAVKAEKVKSGRGSESARRADARRRQPDAGSSAGTTGSGAGGPAVAGADPSAVSWTTVLSSQDPIGDQGPGPAYADLTDVRVDEDGSRVRLVVTMAGAVPSVLDDGEVQGIGLDVFRAGGAESDYQVFLDGGADGWRGYLQGPAGLVEFAGSLVLDGPRLVVVVPWSSLGGRSGAELSSFVDWSTDAGLLGKGGADTGPRGALDVG